MTAAEIAPIDATPFAGVVPWLVSLWRKLRAAVEVHQATNEEQQVLHLIEYVTSAIGGPVLAASDVDDLDDRLDSLIGSEALLAGMRYLLAQHLTLFETAEPPWLSCALTERFLESAKQHLRMLASLPGIVVEEAIVLAYPSWTQQEVIAWGLRRTRTSTAKVSVAGWS